MHARLALDPVHDQSEAVGVEDRLDVLHEHRAALEAHAGVDVLLRERRQRAVGGEVELHEDEVPELDVAVAPLAVGPAVALAAAVLGAAVVVELGARAARAGLAGGAPEVLGAREGHDPLARQALAEPRLHGDVVLPEAEAGVTREDRCPEPVRLEPEPLGDELPGVVDGAVLEVVAEREVAEHLEHRGVPRREADLVEIGVLPAGAEALLDGRESWRRRLLEPREVRLERLHPRRDEERRGVLGRREQRERREAQVLALLEEREKSLPELGRRPHPAMVPPGRRSACSGVAPALRQGSSSGGTGAGSGFGVGTGCGQGSGFGVGAGVGVGVGRSVVIGVDPERRSS